MSSKGARFSFIQWSPWVIAFGLPALYVLVSLHHAFFWDTVQLASKHAHHYYQTGFKELLLPESIDSGHPPTFGMAIAGLWLLFGKSLWVSHLVMMPFALGIGWLSYHLIREIEVRQVFYWGMLLLLADPVLASQLTLVSPDVVLTFFFLLGVWSIWKNQSMTLGLAAMGLAVISTRGMMIAAGLFCYDIALRYFRSSLPLSYVVKRFIVFTPSGLLALTFLIWHYREAGWIGYHADSEWAPGFILADWTGMLRNLVVYLWRMVDFGRITLWIILLILVWRKGLPRLHAVAGKTRDTLLLFLVMTLVTLPTFLLYQGLHMHRYLLPVFLSFTLLFVAVCKEHRPERLLQPLKWTALVGLLLGNTWVYPKQMSQGWDATLAHLPYYGLRKDMIAFLDKENYAVNHIGSHFPNLGPMELIDLNGRTDGFHKADLQQDSIIFYSNIMNDFSDTDLKELEQWDIVHELRSPLVEVILYRRPYSP